MKRFGIGIWGVGRIGRVHAANIHACAGKVELIVVADPIKKRASAIAKKFGCRMVGTPVEMLKDESLDDAVIGSSQLAFSVRESAKKKQTITIRHEPKTA